ncbi:MAG: hypothetical protein ACOX2I_09645 [Candidatus Ozemobacteraceae bacterium]
MTVEDEILSEFERLSRQAQNAKQEIAKERQLREVAEREKQNAAKILRKSR